MGEKEYYAVILRDDVQAFCHLHITGALDNVEYAMVRECVGQSAAKCLAYAIEHGMSMVGVAEVVGLIRHCDNPAILNQLLDYEPGMMFIPDRYERYALLGLSKCWELFRAAMTHPGARRQIEVFGVTRLFIDMVKSNSPTESLQLVIGAGADVNCLAVFEERRIYTKHGLVMWMDAPDVNAQCEGRSTLHCHSIEGVRETALHYAARNRLWYVPMLLAAGADLAARDEAGRMPWQACPFPVVAARLRPS